MAGEGTAAAAAGMDVVPPNATGGDATSGGFVKWGFREINKTRDYIATKMSTIPTNKSGYRAAAGITYSSVAPTSTVPASSADGDVHFKYL